MKIDNILEDKYVEIRIKMAEQGLFLEQLKKDPSKYVRVAALCYMENKKKNKTMKTVKLIVKENKI